MRFKDLINGMPPAVFFKFGVWCFIIIGLANFWGVYMSWPYSDLWLKISGSVSAFFNFVVAYFFVYLSKNDQSQQMPIMDTAQINKMFDEAKK